MLPGLVSAASALMKKDALSKVTLRGISITELLSIVEPCKVTSILEKPPAKVFSEPVCPLADTKNDDHELRTNNAMKRKTAPRLCRCIVSTLYNEE